MSRKWTTALCAKFRGGDNNISTPLAQSLQYIFTRVLSVPPFNINHSSAAAMALLTVSFVQFFGMAPSSARTCQYANHDLDHVQTFVCLYHHSIVDPSAQHSINEPVTPQVTLFRQSLHFSSVLEIPYGHLLTKSNIARNSSPTSNQQNKWP